LSLVFSFQIVQNHDFFMKKVNKIGVKGDVWTFFFGGGAYHHSFLVWVQRVKCLPLDNLLSPLRSSS
jgi:hypothetical protein